MVRDVGRDPLQQDFQGQRPVTRMTAFALEILRLQRSQNPVYLLARDLELVDDERRLGDGVANANLHLRGFDQVRDRRFDGRGGHLATLSKETIGALDRLLPASWSRGNPVDILGNATGKCYADALAVLIGDRAVDAILVLNSPTGLAQPDEAARAVIGVLRAKYAGQMDFGKASGMVKAALTG